MLDSKLKTIGKTEQLPPTTGYREAENLFKKLASLEQIFGDIPNIFKNLFLKRKHPSN